MDALTFLRERVALFEGVAEKHLEALAVGSTLERYAKGSTILFKGATVDHLQVVCTGKAGVYVKPANKPVVQVATLQSGDVFGETSIVELSVAGATIKAEEDDTYVLAIPQDALRSLLVDDAAFAARVKALIDSRKS